MKLVETDMRKDGTKYLKFVFTQRFRPLVKRQN
jgi:hypothetical protein